MTGGRAILVPMAILMFVPFHTASAKDRITEGAHQVVAVVNVATQDEALKLADHDKMAASGISVDDIRDGSFAVGIVYCCNREISEREKVVFYVPPEVEILDGDFVEVLTGRPSDSSKDDKGVYHRAIRSRHTPTETTGECRWDPGDPRQWMNVIYCDWMEEEGWLFQDGLDKSWYKPVTAETAN
jgi:hypothetical protein